MSKKVDEKVVEMSFDNSKFEKNIQTSISSLDRLKEGLNFSGAARGLDEISDSVEGSSNEISGLSAGIESAGHKFSAFEVIAITALANITNSAVNCGKRLVSSLTIDQIAAGWQKYADKTTAVQTIISATGQSIEEVNEQLDKLNWFTDETSYNFVDMVGNIGKFTSMGIDLEKSVTAMMGIANWAAVSGQGTNEASRAMYNLAQAIGVGSVKLQDWKSIENANMATQEFKNLAIETAKALGTLDKEAKTSGGTLVEAATFSSTLSEGWFTSDVLLATLQKYGEYSEEVYKVVQEEGITASEAMEKVGDETMQLGSKAFKAAQEAKTAADAINSVKDAVSTGWMNTFEIIFGNYEEAKVLWTDLANQLYDVFAAGAEDRNELLNEWKDLGGRTLLIDGLFNALTALQNIIETVKGSFREIFPKKTAEQLYSMTESFYNFTERLKNNEKLFDNMGRILKGLFAVLDIGKQLLGSIFRALSPVFGLITKTSGGIFELTATVGDWLVKLDETIKSTKIFDKVFGKIAGIIITVIDSFKKLIGYLKQTKIFNEISGFIRKAATALKNFINAAKEKFESPGFEFFHTLLEKILNVLGKIGEAMSKVKNIFVKVFETIGQALRDCSILQIFSKLWTIIVAVAKCVTSILGKAFSGLFETIKSGNIKGFVDILNSLVVMSMSGGILGFIKNIKNAFSGFTDILDGVSGILDGVRGCFEAYQSKLKADTLMKIASAIAILVASILILSFIDQEKVGSSLAAIAGLLTGLMVAMGILTKMSGSIKKAAKATTMMLGMSISILIMASALKTLSKIDAGDMVVGLAGIAGLMAVLIMTVKVMGQNSKKVMKGATQLVVLALAVKLLASACKSLSKLSWNEMARGLVGVGVLMAEIAVFLKMANFNKKSFSTAVGLVFLATAVKILASACKSFAKLEWEGIGKGLVAIGALLLEIAAFTQLVKPKKMISMGLGLIAIATSMKILASAMGSLANLSWTGIAKGLVAMAGSLVMLVGALNLLPKGMITKGLGLIAVATAILILASALKKMGNQSWVEIGKGLLTLGGAMAILAIGLNAMKGTIGGSAALLVAALALAVFAPVFALLGAMSWKSIAKGLISIAGAIVILGVAGAVLAPIIPAILGLAAAMALIGVGILGVGVGMVAAGLGLTALAAGMTALAATGVATASAFVAMLTVIVTGVLELVPTIAIAIAQGFLEFVRVIGENAPLILESVGAILTSLLELLVNIAPQLVETIFFLLDCVLQKLVEYTPILVQAVFNILIAVLQGIANNIGMVVQTAVDVVIAFIDGVASKIPDVIQAGFDLLLSFLNGIADAIDRNTQPMIDAITRLIKSILNAALKVLSGGIDLFADIGKALMEGLGNGIKKAVNWVKDAVTSVGRSIKNWFCNLFGIHSPSKVFHEYGEYIDKGLADGIKDYAYEVENATGELGDVSMDGMESAIDKISSLMDSEFEDPTIRPVFDLSEIQNGVGSVGKMMSDMDGYNIDGSFNMARQASNGMTSGASDVTSLDELTKSIRQLAQNPASQMENTFNITSDNPKEVAEEVSKILDKQYQRKATAWE